MAYVPVEKIGYDEVLRQGTDKINKTIDAVNGAVVKVDGYEVELEAGIDEAKQIAADAGAEAVQIATDATASIEATANQANANSQTAINTANNAVSTANQNKQEFDQLRNDFDDLVAEAGDSNPEIVQARTDTTGIKQTTLANRLSVDFGDRMTKSDGIEMLSGTTNVKKMMDFTGKTAGNTATNPHQAFSDFTATSLKKPSASWNEVGQSDYNKITSRDDSGISTGSTSNGVIPQQLYKLNAVETVKSMAPQLFEGLDEAGAVQFVKDNFVSLVLTIRGKASSPNNKNLKVSAYVASADTWNTQIQGDATEYTDFTVQINDVNFIGEDGFVYAIAYVDLTNGVTASSIDVDYVGVSVEVSVSALEVLSDSGFAKTEDVASKVELNDHMNDDSNPHAVTKSQVGLASVENYGITTDADAMAGIANTSYMTPKKTALAVEKQIFKGADAGVQYIAHRGSNADYPENTVLAFEAVTRHWGIETDIQVTSDGTWICMHDSTVDRTTDGTGTVASKTLAQIKTLKIDTGSNLASLTDEQKRVPTFDEFLTVCKKNRRVPIIEIKAGNYSAANYDEIVVRLRKFNLVQSPVFISFDYQALVEIKKRIPAVYVQYLVSSITDQAIDDAKALGINSGISVKYNDVSVTEENVVKIHNAGLAAACWTVPDTQFDSMVSLGFDFITTNSKSGNLRFAGLTPLGTFTPDNGVTTGGCYVEEISNTSCLLHFIVRGGTGTRGEEILQLPEWAMPILNKWVHCVVRTSSGVALASVDIIGKLSTSSKGILKVSYGWEARTTWATGDIAYTKY